MLDKRRFSVAAALRRTARAALPAVGGWLAVAALLSAGGCGQKGPLVPATPADSAASAPAR